MQLFSLVCLMSVVPFYAFNDFYSQKEASSALYYNNNCIADDCMQRLLFDQDSDIAASINLVDYYSQKSLETSICQEKELADKDDYYYGYGEKEPNFIWQYKGTLHNDMHVVCGYEEGYNGSNAYVAVGLIKRIDDTLHRIFVKKGQNYQVEVKDDALFYSYDVSDLVFVEMVARMYPDIEPLYKRSSKEGLGYGVGSWCGGFTEKITFNQQGKVVAEVIDSFDCAEGGRYSGKKQGEEIKRLAVDMLRDIDEDKPDALKEDGILLSAACFQLLLENDLKNDDTKESSVQLSLHKDDEYEEDSLCSFKWKYIEAYKDCHCIFAQLHNSHDSSQEYSGIYMIARDGDYLKKVARLAHGVGEQNGIFTGLMTFDVNEFALVNNTFSYSQKASYTRWIEEMKSQLGSEFKIENKQLNKPDALCGRIKMVLEMSDDGTVINQKIAGFCPKKAHNLDGCDVIVAQHQSVPLDEAILSYANEFCKKECGGCYTDWGYYIKGDDLKQVWHDATCYAQDKEVVTV